MASEYLKYLNRDITPEPPPPPLSPKEKWKNWWYYHWKIVVLIVVLVLSVIAMVLKNIGITEPLPDYNIAYIGSHTLSEDAENTIVEYFKSRGEDASGDGRVTVILNQYVMYEDTKDYDSVKLTAAASTALDGDIATQTSYFFLLEDPEHFTNSYQLLADESGALPAPDDLTWGDKVLHLSHIIPDLPEDAQNLYIGRRGFYDEKHTTKYKDACDRLWENLESKSSSNVKNGTGNNSGAIY